MSKWKELIIYPFEETSSIIYKCEKWYEPEGSYKPFGWYFMSNCIGLIRNNEIIEVKVGEKVIEKLIKKCNSWEEAFEFAKQYFKPTKITA